MLFEGGVAAPPNNIKLYIMSLKRKYTSEKRELVEKLKIGNETRVLRVELIETSKVKNHYIYECEYFDKEDFEDLDSVENYLNVLFDEEARFESNFKEILYQWNIN